MTCLKVNQGEARGMISLGGEGLSLGLARGRTERDRKFDWLRAGGLSQGQEGRRAGGGTAGRRKAGETPTYSG